MINDADLGPIDQNDPEFASIDAFVDLLVDMEVSTFTHQHLNFLNYRLGQSTRLIRRELESWGLTLEERGKGRHVRGFDANDNDRWYGPGSSKSHGGSGHEQIQGFAGRVG
jgi:hypothetical protein